MLLWALAQAAAVAVAPAPSAAPAQEGVTSYPAAFFDSAHPNTANDMIARLPGFTLDTGSSVRGYEGAAGNVLIDGQRPTSKTDDLGSLLARILASQVERIDVIRGGAPGIDMQGKTVIANVIRKKGAGGWNLLVHYADQTSTDGRRFPFLRLEASGNFGSRNWELSFDPGRFMDDGFGDGPLSDTNADGSLRNLAYIHSQASGTQLPLTGAFETPFAGGRLRLNGRLFSQVYNSNELDTFSQPAGLTQHDHGDDNKFQTEFGGDYVRPLSARLNLELLALRQTKHEVTADDFQAPADHDVFHLVQDTAETIARAVGKFQQRPALSWEFGGEYALNTLDSATRLSHNDAPIAIPAANVRVEEKRWEVFFKTVWRPLAPLTVEGALRQEGSHISSSGDVTLAKSLYYTKPRVLVTWQVDPDTQLRLRYEREVGQLDFGAFVASSALSSGVVTAGNPNLVPQEDWASEVAVERRFLGSGDLGLTVRHLKITNVVDRAPLGDFDAPANIGNGTEDDVVANLTVPLDRLGLKGAQARGSYTRRWSQVTDPTTHEPRPITALHPSDWDAHFFQPVGNFIYGVDVFGGWQEITYRFNQIETRKLGTYVTPFAEWKPRPDFSFRIELDNVTARGFHYVYKNYPGSRDVTPLDFIEERRLTPGRILYLRVRKTFSG
jgi:hypothetical protein